jgi:hypothetical protein
VSADRPAAAVKPRTIVLPPAARANAVKTRCAPAGHSLDDCLVWQDNRGRWHRRCRHCQRAANAACYRSRRERLAAQREETPNHD